MDPTELLKRVRRIQIRTAHRVSEVLAGQYHSAFRGQGMEFEEVRQYEPGDDVRRIDWNVSARLGEPFVKLFREERELTVMIAVDASASMDFGTRSSTKRELVAELAATIAVSADQNGDRSGLFLFTDRMERWLPPRRGPRHTLRIVRELVAFEPPPPSRQRPGTDLEPALLDLSRVMRKKAVVFVISDFLVPARGGPQSAEHALRLLRGKHDLVPVVVSDRRERELPPVGLVEFFDRERGETQMVDLGSGRVRRRFAAAASADDAARRRLFRRLRVEPIEVQTGDDFVLALTRSFAKRERRR
jgi:uncharacterized protein (DUF58 family)